MLNWQDKIVMMLILWVFYMMTLGDCVGFNLEMGDTDTGCCWGAVDGYYRWNGYYVNSFR